MPLGHVDPEQPPVHVADVPLFVSEAHVALLAGSMNHAGTVHDGGRMGSAPDADTSGFTIEPTHFPPHAARAICWGVRGSMGGWGRGPDGRRRPGSRSGSGRVSAVLAEGGVGAGPGAGRGSSQRG